MIAIDGYLIDAFETESHTFESDVTQDETESGVAFTDNINDKPDVITVVGIVTDTPIGDMVRVRGAATASGLDTDLPFLPSDEAQGKLLAIRAAHKPVLVQTSRGLFTDMLITSLELPVNGDSGDALHFTCTFQKLRIVTTSRVFVRVAAPQHAAKKALTAPPFDKFKLNAGEILDKDHHPVKWDPSLGHYVERDGNVVPDSDLVPPPGSVQFPATGEWINPDGSPVTQSQYIRVDQPTSDPNLTLQRVDPSPWYDGSAPAF